ncbi:MAG TPA: tetratricopeptide repeat protein [Ktedonobacteraceae bacterium]|nr:tetratricopeptide repeat protein [Ktedonobacteraceae bacterium]
MAKTTFFEYLQNTEDAISAGSIDQAMANCQHILSYFPDSLEAHRLLGEIYLAKGQLEDAQQTFDWILVNDPENVVVYCDRALTSERLSDVDTALDCYQQAYELSRGNSQIRLKFNRLSSQVGQQEFMFSRAGLARLYMRGDLLTQAKQEWEAVLNISPERLDARTGLLEACWREGTYDKVEQLANKILEEIPTCLKALLLLAHVISTVNIERSRELLKRAETLDPELVMAQDLFSDLIASQPNDPFIAMLKKDPIVLSDLTDEVHVSNKQTAINTAAISNGTQIFAESEAPTYTSGKLETWKELDTKQSAMKDITPSESLPTLLFQPEMPNVQSSNSITTNGYTSKEETALDQAKTSSAFDEDFDTALLEKQPWYQAENPQTIHSEQATSYALSGNVESPENVHSWSSETQEGDFPTPPAWLDVLTKFERQSGDNPISTSSTPIDEYEKSNEITSSALTQTEPESATPIVWEQDPNVRSESDIAEAPDFFFTTDDNSSEMEWPEWLKSLGAETLETQPEETTAVEVVPEQSLEFQSWTDQLDQTLDEAQQSHMTTLEHLDNDLLSQGFVSLQPGTLNTIAQEPSLSSALAELGNFSTLPLTSEPSSVEEPAGTFLEPEASTEIDAQPSSQDNAMELDEVEIASQNAQLQSVEVPPETTTPQVADEGITTPLETPVAELAASQSSIPAEISATKQTSEPQLIPEYPEDAWLENDLETTMKRPAIRLQPTHQSTHHPDGLTMLGKARTSDQGRAQNDNLSNKERLLRGYQFQLAGAYDDAMAEYRIIIRNAPDLLSEVISNVRALLKLSPKYSAGFRVLGDSYMRQGEYLQAMEAYNRALTIAKKAKSQSV